MNKRTTVQKTTSIASTVSFILSAICTVMLFIKAEEVGTNHPISASLLGSLFFFAFVGLLLKLISQSNLPSFSFKNEQ